MGNYDNDGANGFFVIIGIIAWVSFFIWSLNQYGFFVGILVAVFFWFNGFRCSCACDIYNFKHNFNAF